MSDAERPGPGHSIAYSRGTTSRIMEVLASNRQGNVHGGVIMRMVDEAAAIVAMKHSHHQVVTARVERFDFWKPAYVGDVVTIECALEYVGRTSMQVQVTVTAEALTVDLMDGRTLIVPLVWFPRLWHGTPEERDHFEIFGDGAFLHWPDLDEDLSVAGLLSGLRSGERPESLKKWLAARGVRP